METNMISMETATEVVNLLQYILIGINGIVMVLLIYMWGKGKKVKNGT